MSFASVSQPAARGAKLAILALTLACLAAFAVALPLPRSDGHLVGSDGTQYYVYLPSLVVDGDLDFSDEYTYFYSYDQRAVEKRIEDRTATGLPSNRLGIGPAVLWAPFFVAAHLLALVLGGLGFNVAADGYGYFYQVPVLAGSILYGGLGAWFAFRAACLVSREAAALAATLLTVLAGNAVYYMTVEPSMSHASSMFASSAFFYLWLRSRDQPDAWSRAGLGALAGLMALIRPQDGLLLVLPLLDEALSWQKKGPGSASRLPTSLSMVGVALLTFTPQLVVWKLLNGGFLISGYAREVDGLFRGSAAHLLDVMFSAQRGLLAWHPVFLLAWSGIWLLARRDRRLAALCGLGFLIQWAVIGSWHDWAQGDAFGGRMFIVLTPVFVLGIATVAERIVGRRARRLALAGGVALILLNVLLLAHYRLELLAHKEPLDFAELLLGRFRLFL